MVEYHVVRQGVNHREIVVRLKPRFERVELVAYWSCVSPAFQRLGEVLDIANSFALWAEGYLGEPS